MFTPTHAGSVVISYGCQNILNSLSILRNVLILGALPVIAMACGCIYVSFSTSCAVSMEHFNFEHFIIYSMLSVMTGAHAVRFIVWTVRELVQDLKRHKNQQ